MNNSGIIRRIDVLGRIVIPIDMRRSLSLANGDPVVINLSEDGSSIQLNHYYCEDEYDAIIARLQKLMWRIEKDRQEVNNAAAQRLEDARLRLATVRDILLDIAADEEPKGEHHDK